MPDTTRDPDPEHDTGGYSARPFGPFTDACSPSERNRLLGLLEAFAHVYSGGDPAVPDALRRASFGGRAELREAWEMLNGLPALPLRKVLSHYAARIRRGGPYA